MKWLPPYRRPIPRSRYLAVLLVLIMLPPGAAIWIRPGLSQVRQGLVPQPPVTRQALPPNLAHGRWDPLPPAPITVRQDAVHVWTGTELLVWGGHIYSHDEPIFDDGAAYNPTTHRWRRLPVAPLGPRFGATGVWTGSEVVIWGGEGKSLAVLNDGAAYNPASNTWRPITAAPIPARVRAFATWTGRQVLVWGGQPAIRTTDYAGGGIYDPSSNSWEVIPPAPFAPNGAELSTVSVWTGRVLYAWRNWERDDPISPNGFSRSFLVDGAAYDPSSKTWRLLAPSRKLLVLGSEGFWTGKQIIVRQGPFPGPSPFGLPSSLYAYDPMADTWTDVVRGDLDAGDLVLTWIGDGLVVENGGVQLGGPDGRQIVPGDTAEYLLAEDRWISLARAPNGGPGGAPGVWTGDRILYWGSQASSAQPGLSFTP